MYEIRTIMSTDVVWVRRNTPVSEVIELLVAHDVTGIPVVNNDGTLAGIVTEKDLMGLLADGRSVSGRAEDYMTREVVCFEEDDDLIAVCECLVANDFRRVPILRQGKLVGIISRRDLIKYILEPISQDATR
jgi:CBS domain-containing protein